MPAQTRNSAADRPPATSGWARLSRRASPKRLNTIRFIPHTPQKTHGLLAYHLSMEHKRPDPLSGLLATPGTHLTSLTAEARRLEALRQRVLRSLDADTAPHRLGADLKDGVLTLFMDSAAWTTTL